MIHHITLVLWGFTPLKQLINLNVERWLLWLALGTYFSILPEIWIIVLKYFKRPTLDFIVQVFASSRKKTVCIFFLWKFSISFKRWNTINKIQLKILRFLKRKFYFSNDFFTLVNVAIVLLWRYHKMKLCRSALLEIS